MYTSLPLRAVVYGMQRYEIYNTKKAARGLNLALGASQSLVLLLLRKSKKHEKQREGVALPLLKSTVVMVAGS